ncbi:MAG: ArsR/SmtB family transcription factor [Natronosporangium sp.]
MPIGRMELLAEPDELRGALAPLRRRLLVRLRTPASATELARELGMGRQKINYHLRKLEDAGLVELVELRRRRGCQERVLRARADAFVVDPGVLTGSGRADPAGSDRTGPARSAGPELTRAGDRHAVDHLVAVASETVREVTRMQTAADRAGLRLLTFTLESQVRLAEPADLHRFTEALAGAMATVVAEFDAPGGRPYRVVGAGHPFPDPEPSLTTEHDGGDDG